MWLIFRSVDWLYFAFKKNFLVHGLQRLTLIAIKLWKKLVLWILMSTSAIHALTGNFFRQFFNVTVYKTFCKLALIIFYGTPPKSTYSGHTEWLLWLKTQLRQNFCQKGRRTGPSAAQERCKSQLWRAGAGRRGAARRHEIIKIENILEFLFEQKFESWCW